MKFAVDITDKNRVPSVRLLVSRPTLPGLMKRSAKDTANDADKAEAEPAPPAPLNTVYNPGSYQVTQVDNVKS